MGIGYDEGDRRTYESELKGFLPQRIFDAHAHLFTPACFKPGHEFAPKRCYRKFGGEYPLELFLSHMAALLPGHEIHANHFASPDLEADLEASAAYSGSVSDNARFFGMALVSPKDEISDVKRRIDTMRLCGYKPYLNFVNWKPKNEIRVFDMLTREQLEFANERRLAITLHIPREGRLADPVNQRDMVELCRSCPDTKIIFAHIGRAYYLNCVESGLDGIAKCPNAYIDTAMINHEGILECAFRKFPRERILFGSDAPIAMLRGKSVEINNQYAYLMGEDYEIGTSIYDAAHAVKFTFFYYELLRGMKLAAKRAGLSSKELEGLFFGNAQSLFSEVANFNFKKVGQ